MGIPKILQRCCASSTHLPANSSGGSRHSFKALRRAFRNPAPLLYELLPKAGPSARHDIVALLSSGKTLLDFLQRMERGEIPKSIIGPEQRWGFQHSGKGPVKELATKLFGTVSSDRAKII